jgi:hypothetical protein
MKLFKALLILNIEIKEDKDKGGPVLERIEYRTRG